MSVIVKGMEMPTKCCDCDAESYDESFYGDEIYHACSFIYKGYTDDIRECGRLEECPLRPLPEKHGPMIDCQALLEEARRLSGPFVGDGWSNQGVFSLIARQPAIVEAEGDG